MEKQYIGKADIRFLDKKQKKLGAFLEMDYNELVDILFQEALTRKEFLQTVKFKVLPNKMNTGYTLKIEVK